jgi:hypothetical protein
MKPDAIVSIPVDVVSSRSVFKKADDAGIKIVFMAARTTRGRQGLYRGCVGGQLRQRCRVSPDNGRIARRTRQDSDGLSMTRISLLRASATRRLKNHEKTLKSQDNAAQPPFSVRAACGYAASAVAGQV